MFCTADDFKLLPYAIPNLSQYPNTFQTYIDKHETEVLTKLLGVQLYNEFIAGLGALPDDWDALVSYIIGDTVVNGVSIWEALTDNVGVTPVEGLDWTKVEDNIWLKIVNGFVFTSVDTCSCSGSGEYATQWLGLNDMLIPYIFYNWLRDNFDNFSGIGVVQAKAENAEVISPARRLVEADTEFCLKALTLEQFIRSANVPDIVYNNYYPYYYPHPINTFGI